MKPEYANAFLNSHQWLLVVLFLLQELCKAHGHSIQQNSRSLLPALRSLQKAITRLHQDLSDICSSNEYLLRYLCSSSTKIWWALDWLFGKPYYAYNYFFESWFCRNLQHYFIMFTIFVWKALMLLHYCSNINLKWNLLGFELFLSFFFYFLIFFMLFPKSLWGWFLFFSLFICMHSMLSKQPCILHMKKISDLRLSFWKCDWFWMFFLLSMPHRILWQEAIGTIWLENHT